MREGQEAGEERAGSRLPSWQGLGEIIGKSFCNILKYFAIEMGLRDRNWEYKGMRSGRLRSSCPSPTFWIYNKL